MTAEIRTLLARLELVSHAPIGAYGRQTPDSGEDVGGKRPPGTDREHRPRAPKSPRIEGDVQSEKAWDEFEAALEAWQGCYHRRTVAYFRRRLDRCVGDGELRQIRRELEETIEAWRRMPMTPGQPPLSVADPQWKRYVAESREDAGALATRYSVTRRYINKVRQQYREMAA